MRAAAAEQGLSVSVWLAGAAQAQVRQLFLREALDAAAAADGGLTDTEIDQLVTATRRTSRLVAGVEGAA